MNTFLPLADFTASAEALDNVRLQQQRSAVVQILKACSEPAPEDGKEHPAIKMWRGNELALIRYGMMVCLEWAARGNSDATMQKITAFKGPFEEAGSSAEMPEWFGNEDFHDSHKAHLLRLKPTHYRQFWPNLSDDLALVWPRSPEKAHKTAEQKEADRLYRKAVKAKEQLEKAQTIYAEACEAAGIDPETFEFKDDNAEAVTIGVPDPDLLDL